MLKLSDGQPLSCLLESVQGGATRASTLHHRSSARFRSGARLRQTAPRVDERPCGRRLPFKPVTAPTLRVPLRRAALPPSAIELPCRAAAESRPVSSAYMGFRYGALDRAPAAARSPTPWGYLDAVFVRPTLNGGGRDTIKDEMAVVTPGRSRPGHRCRRPPMPPPSGAP
jgi:hypothetical protein